VPTSLGAVIASSDSPSAQARAANKESRLCITFMEWLTQSEEGHAMAALPVLGAMAGAIVLAIGAVNDSSVTTIIGGIVLAIGILAGSLAEHVVVDYDVYARLEKLEGKK
jgi:hypothetical protein